MKKSEINEKDLEKDINKLLSFLDNIDNLDIETKYKDHLDDKK